MGDDKKPPRPQVMHRDYGGMPGRQTPGRGVALIKSNGSDRGDPTPTPVPGSVSNEDLAVRIRDVDKKHEEFAQVTTLRLERVETRVERVPKIEEKVDKLLLLTAEKQQKQEILSMDISRAHVEVETREKVAGVEVSKEKQILTMRNDHEQKAYDRKLKLRIGAIVGTICSLIATAVTLLAGHC